MTNTDKLIAQRLKIAESRVATARQSIETNQRVIARQLEYIERLKAKLSTDTLTHEFTPIPSTGQSG